MDVVVPGMMWTECSVHADTDLELNLTCGLKTNTQSSTNKDVGPLFRGCQVSPPNMAILEIKKFTNFLKRFQKVTATNFS